MPEVFNAATNLTSGSEYSTSNLHLGQVYRIKEVLDNAFRDDSLFIQEMAQKMKRKFNTYWGEGNLLMIVASLMDPRVKFDAVKYCYLKIYGKLNLKFIFTMLKKLC